MGWLPHTVTSEPAGEPVAIESARIQVQTGIDDDSYDTELGIYLKAARETIERECGLKLMTQTVRLCSNRFCDLLHLPIGPVQSVAVNYLDANGDEQTVDPGDYRLVTSGRRAGIVLNTGKSWPPAICAPDAVRVDAVAGYASSDAVPEALKLAILVLTADWFANREDSSVLAKVRLPNAASRLIRPYRNTI